MGPTDGIIWLDYHSSPPKQPQFPFGGWGGQPTWKPLAMGSLQVGVPESMEFFEGDWAHPQEDAAKRFEEARQRSGCWTLGFTYLLLNHVMWVLECHPLAKTSLHFIEGCPWRTWTLVCPSRKMERPRQVRTSSRDSPLLSPQRNHTKASRI